MLTNEEALEILRALRKFHIRRPDVVLQLGPSLENMCSETELWELVEQMYLAALDLKLSEKAELLLSRLLRQFPGSVRVRRLEGMRLEAKGDFDAAIEIYDKLLLENPSNVAILQRVVCRS